jgi:serine/threonine protein kinase
MPARQTSSPPRESIDRELTQKIQHAVLSTVQKVPIREREARSFLPRGDLDRILSTEALEQLFAKLIADQADRRGPVSAKANSSNGNKKKRDAFVLDSSIISDCVKMTTEVPRKALLALFLYQDRADLLTVFMRWVQSDDTEAPSDNAMPFTESDLKQHGIDEMRHWDILRTQPMFMPVNIRKDQHVHLHAGDRLPFIATQADAKSGSSGTVTNMIIAQNHWEESIGGHFEIANKHSSKVVALKTFKDIPNVRDMARTTEEFEIERKILEGFRSHNMTHAMIMLDWGSITILDEAERPISHALIFELASFSLADFLNSKEWAQKYQEGSLLLGKLVDIVEAVAFLHEKLETLHLDIKPANILVFEEISGRSDTTEQHQEVLLLKLSDFGLARKIGSKQRTGHDRSDTHNAWSCCSATSATRPAGVYQAPEIQERKSSHAGNGSDVWSIGCVALMVLAFSHGGPPEVDELTRQLSVNFLVAGGREHLFYIRSDSHPWENGDVKHHRYRYLGDFSPVTGPIPGTDNQLQAAVNPQVIAWSNVLYDQYKEDLAQPFIHQWLELIFCFVLLIDHKQRMRAAVLHQKLKKVQTQWKEMEDNPGDARQHATILYPPTPSGNQQNLVPKEIQQVPVVPPQRLSQDSRNAPAMARSSPIDRTNRITTTSPRTSLPLANFSNPLPGSSPVPQPSQQPSPQPPSRLLTPEVIPISILCAAIKEDNAVVVQRELYSNRDLLKQHCPGSSTYPIHFAIKHKAYDALGVLIKNADRDITNLECGGRTVLEMASEKGGDARALNQFREFYSVFLFPESVYKRYKNKLGSDAGRAFEELYKQVNLKKNKRWSFMSDSSKSSGPSRF